MTHRSQEGTTPGRCLATIGCLFVLLLVACSSSNTSSTRDRSSGSPRPNIVFVLTDDLSWNLVPYMAHVKAMQDQGVTFSNYFVTDSLCCPSRVSILTGRFPHSTGVFTNAGPDGGFHVFHDRGGEKDTFATTLQRHGYRTALMGKYLNEYDPASTLGGRGPYVPPGWSEWDVAGNAYGEYDYILNENGRIVRYGNAPNAYLTDVIAAKGVSFIDRSVGAGDPFLLVLSTFAPHGPYVPAPRHRELFPGLGAPRTGAFDKAVAGAPAWMAAFPALSERQTAEADRDFRQRVQMVQAVDDMLGRVHGNLRAKRQLDNTYIIFSSDNGFHIGEHRLPPGKMTAFDTDIRVPLVIVGPGVPAGRTFDQITETSTSARRSKSSPASLRPLTSSAAASSRSCGARLRPTGAPRRLSSTTAPWAMSATPTAERRS